MDSDSTGTVHIVGDWNDMSIEPEILEFAMPTNWPTVTVGHLHPSSSAISLAAGPAMASISPSQVMDETSPIQKQMERLLQSREPPKTFCPSEVARALSTSELQELQCASWREAMDSVRELAWSLRDAGRVEVLQKGTVLDVNLDLKDVKGPIRLRRKS